MFHIDHTLLNFAAFFNTFSYEYKIVCLWSPSLKKVFLKGIFASQEFSNIVYQNPLDREDA